MLQNVRIHYSTFFENGTFFVEHFEALASFFVSCWYCLFKCIKRGCFRCLSNQLLEVRLIVSGEDKFIAVSNKNFLDYCDTK